MSCGGRVYKGDSIAISIPFDVSGYTDLTVSYFTIGDTKIVRDESGLTVADGYITAEFSGHDLDLLPDGVVRYTIEYAVDNTDYVESSNTMLFLKTPASYNSITPEEIYQSGYTAGYDDCGEGDCSEIQNIAYNSGLTVGYESGYTAGQDDCPLDCDAAYNSGYTQGYQGGYGVGYQGGYSQGYQGGYSQGQADCPDCPACDCTEAYDSGYTQGYQGGYQGGYSVGYQGGYGVGYQGGYAQGQADCPECPACDCTEAYQSGLTVGAAEQKSKLGRITRTTNGTFTTTGDGWSSVTVNVNIPNINDYDFAIGFHGACTFNIHDDNNVWNRNDNTTKLGYYISKLYVPEDNVTYEFDEMNMKQSFTISFSGDGYHMVWFYLNNDFDNTSFNWANVISGETYVNIDFVYIQEQSNSIDTFFPNNQYTTVSIVRNPQTSEDAVMRFLYEH